MSTTKNMLTFPEYWLTNLAVITIVKLCQFVLQNILCLIYIVLWHYRGGGTYGRTDQGRWTLELLHHRASMQLKRSEMQSHGLLQQINKIEDTLLGRTLQHLYWSGQSWYFILYIIHILTIRCRITLHCIVFYSM